MGGGGGGKKKRKVIISVGRNFEWNVCVYLACFSSRERIYYLDTVVFFLVEFSPQRMRG